MELYSVEKADASETTKMEIETFSYRWDIHGFKTIFQSLKGEKESSQFVCGQHSWCLFIKKTTVNGIEYLGLFLRLRKIDPNRKDDDKKVVASYQFNVLDENDVSKFQGESEFHKMGLDWGWGWNRFFEMTDQNYMNIISMDTLRIFCRVWVQRGTKTICRSHEQANAVKTMDKIQMSDDLKKMWKAELFCDIVLSTGSQEFKAHKCILSARSSVFAAMLNTDMVESNSNVIHIDDFPGDIIKEMLNYLYHGEVENMQENCLELLRIGDKYDIQSLVNASVEAILTTLTCENAVTTLLAVNKYSGLEKLRITLFEYIGYNIDVIKKQPEFQTIQQVDSELFLELIGTLL